MDIQNCFTLGCPAKSEALTPTEYERIRFCEICKRKVFCPRDAVELLGHFHRGERVAFDPEKFPNLAYLFLSKNPPPADPGADLP